MKRIFTIILSVVALVVMALPAQAAEVPRHTNYIYNDYSSFYAIRVYDRYHCKGHSRLIYPDHAYYGAHSFRSAVGGYRINYATGKVKFFTGRRCVSYRISWDVYN